MKILRDPEVIALNDVIAACLEAADHHRDTADIVDEAALEQRLIKLAERREEFAQRFMGAVRREGDVPATPALERRAVKSLATRVKAAVSRDDLAVLLEECRSREAAVQQAAGIALELLDEGAEHQALARLVAEAEQNSAWLSDSAESS